MGPITVAVSRVASVELRLKVGSSSITVEVKQDAPLLEPSNPNRTTSFSSTQLADLPNPGNDLSYVANFTPGVVANVAFPNSNSNGNFQFNGLRSQAHDFPIDRLHANSPYIHPNLTRPRRFQ